MDNPIKMDDLGVPPFQDTSIQWYTILIYGKYVKPGHDKQT